MGEEAWHVKRTDPYDGTQRSLADLHVLYTGHYTDEEILAYHQNDCKEVNIEDTNCAGLGSDEDKALRKEAAQTEAAWQECGLAPGLEIWRIEHFNVVAVDKDTYGQFHKGDSYIALHTQQEKDDGKLTRTIYFYLGTDTSIDERGTAAYKTVELDDFFDGEPTQVRVVMEAEPEAFTALFEGGIKKLEGGIDSGFKHVVPEGYDTKLMQLRRVKGEMQTIQVPLSKKKINDVDCFVLDAPDKMYVLDGAKATPFEKNAANEAAENLENSRTGNAAKTREIDDGFWALLAD